MNNVPQVADWYALDTLAREFQNAVPIVDRRRLAPVLAVVGEPVIQLQRLADMIFIANTGDEEAAAAAYRILMSHHAAIPEGSGRRPGHVEEQSPRQVGRPGSVAGRLLLEGGLVQMMMQAAAMMTGQFPDDVMDGLEALESLVAGAATADSLSRSLGVGRNLGDQLDILGRDQGILDAGDILGGLLGPDLDWQQVIPDRLKKPDPWNHEIWEPVPPWWVELVPIYDPPPGLDAMLKCFDEVKDLIRERASILPPKVTADTHTAEAIRSLDPHGRCWGSLLVIHGSGFLGLRDAYRLLLPTFRGCRPANPHVWSDNRIEVLLPSDVSSGPVGFASMAYIQDFEDWEADQARRLDEIRAHECYFMDGDNEPAVKMGCPPNLGRNMLSAGIPRILMYQINGAPGAVVSPGQPLTLRWTVQNALEVSLVRTTADGPIPPAGSFVPPAGSPCHLGAFNGNVATVATYQLRVVGPCGQATASVSATLRRVPELAISNIEVTQSVQVAVGTPLPLVAQKDTIVRVQVSCAPRGFRYRSVDDEDIVEVTGALRISGVNIPPLTAAEARPAARISRAETRHTLNFRIPAHLATGTAAVRVRAWTTREYEKPPDGELMRGSAVTNTNVQWVNKRAFKIRYVRVSTAGTPAPTDEVALRAILDAVQLFPTPPLDIAPARLATWFTSTDPAQLEGKETLLDHLDDQHDCSLSEALFPWEDECPDDDGSVWVGLSPAVGGGLAQSFRAFVSGPGRNTVVTSMDRRVIAHELGHTRKINHVNPIIGCPFNPAGDYDSLPNGGLIATGDAFDLRSGGERVVAPGIPGQLYDIMTYACDTWISPTNWSRLAGKF